MQLTLFRHGQAEINPANDAERRLTDTGRLDNVQVAARLLERVDEFDHAWVSPLRRARETAVDLESVFGKLNFQQCRLLTPDSDPRIVLRYLNQHATGNTVLVSHNPLLSDLWSLLVNGHTQAQDALRTSGVVALECEHWAAGCGEFLFSLEPEERK